MPLLPPPPLLSIQRPRSVQEKRISVLYCSYAEDEQTRNYRGLMAATSYSLGSIWRWLRCEASNWSSNPSKHQHKLLSNAKCELTSSSDELNTTTMSSICETGVLPARPDIEGIGTRVATYAQLLLAIFTIAFSPDASSFDSWWAILVTSLGLQFAAVAQRNGLTLFHALVMTWLAFPVFAMSWVYIFLHWRSDAMPAEILLATHIHGFLFLG